MDIKLEKNSIIKKQKTYMILSSIFPIQPFISSVLVIFYLSYLNISISQYLLLDGILFMSIAFLEVPTGFISDYFGRKKVLIIGRIIVFISMFVLIKSNNFFGGLISILLLGTGVSLGSGNIEAILYEYFLENDNIDNFAKINANKNTIGLIFSIIYAILSGFIFTKSKELILYLDILFLAINSFIIYIFLIDKYPKGKKDRIENIGKKENNNKEFYKELIRFKNVILIFIIMALIFAFFRTTFNYYQPIYGKFNFNIELFGFFNMIFIFLASIGNQIYSRVLSKIKSETMQINFMIAILIITSIIIFMTKNISFMVMGMLFIQQIIRGINMSLQPIVVNNTISKDTKYRTLYISFFSMITTIITALFIFLSSVISRQYNIFLVLIIMSVLILTTALAINILNSKKINVKKN